MKWKKFKFFGLMTKKGRRKFLGNETFFYRKLTNFAGRKFFPFSAV